MTLGKKYLEVENVIQSSLNKQAQEVIFSTKLSKSSHPKICFNNAPVFCANCQKHLGMYLDETQR